MSSHLFPLIPGAPNGYELSPKTGLWWLVTTAGNALNLNSLGLVISAYTGAGLPQLDNQVTPFGILGGSFYQRTVPRSRLIVLVCTINSKSGLLDLQKVRQTLINYLAPDILEQEAADIKLRFQLADYCGNAIGKLLEVPVKYVSGLEGNTDNISQEKLNLQFIELAPPSIRETSDVAPSLTSKSLSSTAYRIALRSATGTWSVPGGQPATGVNALLYDTIGNLWYASSADVSKLGGAAQAVNAAAFCIAQAPNGDIYVGGQFTTPQSYIMRWNGASWNAVGATINNTISALCFDNVGNLYAGGSFSAPGAKLGKWNGSAWSALGTGVTAGTLVDALARGLDGNIYIGGSFSALGGVTNNNIGRWNVASGAFGAAMGSGTNGQVYCLAVGPDGTLYLGGAFTTANGITCNRIAAWNGQTFKPLGAGFDATVFALAFGSDGKLYASGAFTALGDNSYPLPDGLAVWNGSTWLPIDVDIASPNITGLAINTDGTLSIGGATSTITNASGITSVNNAGTAAARPTVTFTGPGQLYSLENFTTGKGIYFNYTLLAGETATLNLADPSNISFTSSFFGNVLGRILPGSDLTTWGLKPGNNVISTLISGTTSGATGATLTYRNTHWSFDASGN